MYLQGQIHFETHFIHSRFERSLSSGIFMNSLCRNSKVRALPTDLFCWFIFVHFRYRDICVCKVSWDSCFCAFMKGAVQRQRRRKPRAPRKTRARSVALGSANGLTCGWASASCPWPIVRTYVWTHPWMCSSIRWEQINPAVFMDRTW